MSLCGGDGGATCGLCCATSNPDGAKAYSAAGEACVAAACGDTCGGDAGSPDASKPACLFCKAKATKSAACQASIAQTCSKTAACDAFQTCKMACGDGP